MIDQFKLSPMARVHLLKETFRESRYDDAKPQWTAMDDTAILELIGQTADDFARDSPNSAGWHFANLLQQIGIRLARPYSFKCACGRDVKVNQ